MVWKTTQSAFYRAVDTFNNGEIECENRNVPHSGKCVEKNGCHSPEKLPGNKCENHRRNEDICRPDTKAYGCSPEKRHENKCEDRRRNEDTCRPGDHRTCGCPHCRVCRRQPAPITRMFSDNDMLLIAGLILILMRQNADQKLILALAFVLLT